MSSLGNPRANEMSQGVYNPVTEQALCVLNAVYNRQLYAKRLRSALNSEHLCFEKGTSHDYSARRHELAFATNDQYSVGSQMSSGQNDVPLLTSFNGLGVSNQEVKALRNQFDKEDFMEELYRLVRSKVRFIGVNLATVNAENNNRADQMAIVFAGLITVTNTGPARINIMEKVVWDVPPVIDDKENYGKPSKALPGTKAVAMIKSYKAEAKKLLDAAPKRIAGALARGVAPLDRAQTKEASLAQSLSRLIAAASGKTVQAASYGLQSALTDNDEARDALASAMETMRFFTDELDSRIIGTASNSAHPGQQLDVLVRHAK